MPNKITHISLINWNKLDLSDEINIAADMIVADTRKGIHRGDNIDGKAFDRLEDSTIKAKRKKGSMHPAKPLWDEGIMKEVYVKPRATKARPKADIQVPVTDKRVEIGIYHNVGIPGKLPKREWYGLGKRVLNKLRRVMEMRLNQQLKIGRVR